MEKHLKLDKEYFIWDSEKVTLEYLGVLTYVKNLKDNYYALNFSYGYKNVKYLTKTYGWILRNMVDEEKAKNLLYYYNREQGEEYDDSYYGILLHRFFIQNYIDEGKYIRIKYAIGYISYDEYKKWGYTEKLDPNIFPYYLKKYHMLVGGRGIYKSLEMHTKIQKETKPFYKMSYAFVDEYPEYFDSLPEKIVINRPKETVALLYNDVNGGYEVYKSKRQKNDRNDFDVELGFYIAFYKYCMCLSSSEFQKTKINKIYALRKTKRQILDYFKVYFEDYLLDLDMSANQIKRFQQTIKYFDMYEGKINEIITIGGKDIIIEVI